MISLFSLELHAACFQELTCLDGKTLVDVTWKHDVLKAEASTAFTCIRPHENDTHSASERGTRMEMALEVAPEELQQIATLHQESEADVDETKGPSLTITL